MTGCQLKIFHMWWRLCFTFLIRHVVVVAGLMAIREEATKEGWKGMNHFHKAFAQPAYGPAHLQSPPVLFPEDRRHGWRGRCFEVSPHRHSRRTNINRHNSTHSTINHHQPPQSAAADTTAAPDITNIPPSTTSNHHNQSSAVIGGRFC